MMTLVWAGLAVGAVYALLATTYNMLFIAVGVFNFAQASILALGVFMAYTTQVTFELPFDAKIHFLGTHIHPYGVSIELYNVSRQEPVWKGVRKSDPGGPMEIYSNPAGYSVRAGETYKITAIYDNPTADKIDAMAGLFMLYSRD